MHERCTSHTMAANFPTAQLQVSRVLHTKQFHTDNDTSGVRVT